MRITGPFEIAVHQGRKASAGAARAIEKTSAASTLGGKSADAEARREKSAPRVQVELVCQDGTPKHDPFWDAPRLLPTFVTQVMAQAMPERRQTTSWQTAYGSVGSPRMALILDRKS